MLEEEVPLPFSETGVGDVVVVREGVALVAPTPTRKRRLGSLFTGSHPSVD